MFNEGLFGHGRGLTDESAVAQQVNTELTEDAVSIEFDTEDGTRTRSMTAAAITFIIMKGIEHLTKERGPRVFQKMVDKFTSLLEEKKVDPNKVIKIPGYGETTVKEFINSWRNIGKVLWPQANWNSLDNIEVGAAVEHINEFIAGIDKIEKLTDTQKNTLKGKVAVLMIMRKNQKAGSVNEMKMTDTLIDEINTMANNLSSLNLTEDVRSASIFDLVFEKIKIEINK